MSTMTVFAAEAARDMQTTRRDGLVALAEYLTDQDDYPDPWDVFAAFCPGVARKTVEDWAADLLRCVVARAASPATFNPFDLELALDYLTGVR